MLNVENYAKKMGVTIEDILSLYLIFLDEMKVDLENLKKAYSNKNYETIASILHNVKGVFLNMEIYDFGNHTKNIYDKYKINNNLPLENYIDEFDETIKQLSSKLNLYKRI